MVEKLKVFVLSTFLFRSRDKLIKEHNVGVEFDGLYSNVENMDEVQIAKLPMLQKWSQLLKQIDCLHFI